MTKSDVFALLHTEALGSTSAVAAVLYRSPKLCMESPYGRKAAPTFVSITCRAMQVCDSHHRDFASQGFPYFCSGGKSSPRGLIEVWLLFCASQATMMVCVGICEWRNEVQNCTGSARKLSGT